ncbi:DUF58 domain-containing protein [Megalodesulfovibrio paquesii]
MPAHPLRAFRLFPHAPPTHGRVALGLTRYGWWFLAAMAVMLVASMNYNLNLGFGLTFLLVGASLAACLQTRRALLDIRLTPGSGVGPGVFAGGLAEWHIQALAPTDRLAIAVHFLLDDDAPGVDLPAGMPVHYTLRMPAPRRGRLLPGPVTLQTVWPLGLFRAWTVVELELECLVWPAPAAQVPDFVFGGGGEGEGQSGGPGVDDFRELRAYVPGDPPRRVSWKASTRGRGLLVKAFEGTQGRTAELDLATTPGSDPEAKLAVLSGQILRAHGLGLEYVLRLPGRRVGEGLDPQARKRRCLDALALYRPAVYGPGAEDDPA